LKSRCSFQRFTEPSLVGGSGVPFHLSTLFFLLLLSPTPPFGPHRIFSSRVLGRVRPLFCYCSFTPLPTIFSRSSPLLRQCGFLLADRRGLGLLIFVARSTSTSWTQAPLRSWPLTPPPQQLGPLIIFLIFLLPVFPFLASIDPTFTFLPLGANTTPPSSSPVLDCPSLFFP